MVDLIVVAAITQNEDYIDRVISSVSNHNFDKKYILLDGAPEGKLKTHYEKYRKYKKRLRKHYTDFIIIEYDECIYYRKILDKFLKENYEAVAKNLLIIQDDVLLDNFNLDEVIQLKGDFNDPFLKIIYFRENRRRAPHWFNVIDDSQELIKTHGWSERVYLITKENLIDILNNLPHKGGCNGKFIEFYYQNMMQRKTWQTITDEEQLQYWQKWGCYEHKTIHHKHLVAKR
jgi:hypothetical protein